MIRFIDLFAGIGGFRVALENNNAQCVFSCEIDKFAREVYFNNFKEYPEGDIKNILARDIPEHEILCAGFPCQPFSIAGKRKGFDDTRGTLFFEVHRIISEKRPKAFILENVAGIKSHDQGNTLKVIEKKLRKLNYDIEWRLLNTKDYGIPQNRNRWYCIGIDKNIDVHYDIDDLFQIKKLNIKLNDFLIQERIKEFNISKRAEENIKKNINSVKNTNEDELLICNNIRPSKVSFRNDGIIPCLTAKMGTGGNNVPVIWEFKRKLTIKECLELMGFPKSFVLKENYSQSYKQIGNSISIQIVDSLAENIIKVIGVDS